ncbi:Uu.00g119460.m01.CDS01 [Anthostomella pinea]|uniref:Uu.00g119460.m01.CDS01 n=1 Tax=Anthostomella pinea TaxID=933095 RepID=A0AAI8VBD2_9PEZI|nr:Uu.00g119460.m01.CDS01 [Anthostomella pinea]
MTTTAPERLLSPTPSQIPLPGSIYSYASTANQLSSYSLPLPPPPRPAHAVLTKADLELSQQAYSDLLATAKSYRIALSSLSTAASAFGSALESCARLKESRADSLSAPPAGANLTNSFTSPKGSCTADLLLGASGVHHLIANHQQILSETVYRSFEVPLLHELDKWRRDMEDEDASYQQAVAQRSREIRRLEKDGLKLHKQRRRDVGKFREHLVELTGRLDGLTALHGDHARAMLRESQETSVKILDASCSLVRAEVDIFEGLARKGWSGGGLDDLLEKGQDLFASEDDDAAAAFVSNGAGGGGAGAADGTKLFSILPPRSILADSGSDSGGRGRTKGGHGRADSLLVETDRYQSLAGAVVDRDRTDTESIFSEFNQSRGVRPFSPQPIRRRATDVIMDPESLLLGHEDYGNDDGGSDGGAGGDDDGVEGARDASAQGLTTVLNGDEIDADADSPWRDMGLERTGGEGDLTPQPVDPVDASTADERERRWSPNEEDVE